MAQILALVGSVRHWGNSEMLARQVLAGAAEEGASVHLLRLSALRLEPCTGCLRCVIGGKPCPIQDDMPWLIETIGRADGLVLAAPTYFLGPAAVVKLILDRLLMVCGRVDDALPPARPAVTVAAAGLEAWRGITLPLLNALVAAVGFQPIESRTAFAPGPGEVLLDDRLMAWALVAGQRLGRGELGSSAVPLGVCPTCRCDAFVLRGHQATCPVCGREAIVRLGERGVDLAFTPAQDAHPRWTPEGLRSHMIDWVQTTGPRYAANRAEVKTRRAPYRQQPISWLEPPPSAQALRASSTIGVETREKAGHE